MRKVLYVLLIISSAFLSLTGCEDDPVGDAGANDIIITVKTVANGNAVGGVVLSYEGISVTTGDDGTATVTISVDTVSGELPESITVSAAKKFFTAAPATFTTADYEGLTSISEEIEVTPRIFIPDTMGNNGTGKIVAIDDMSGANRVELSEIPGYADSSIETGDESDDENGKLDCPTAINVDYDNGIIYIFDVESWGSASSANDYAVLLRLTDFPTTASETLAASAVEFFILEQSPDNFVNTVQQAVITGSDELLVVTGVGDYDDRMIYKISGMSSSSVTITEAAVNDGPDADPETLMTNGLAVLPDGKIIYLRSNGFLHTDYIKELDNFTDNTQSDFYSGTTYSDNSNYIEYGIRLLTNLEGTLLFSADTYEYDPDNIFEEPDPSTTDYDRIIKFDLSSSASDKGRINYGNPGTGVAQFNNPVPLAVLPDNRLYIMDAGNNRLIRVDWKDDTPTGWTEYKPTGDNAFNFNYFNFYNPCGG